MRRANRGQGDCVIRTLCRLASALSLVLCVATAVMWVRSYWLSDAFGRSTLDVKALRYTSPMIVLQSGWIAVFSTTWDLDHESFPLLATELRDSPGPVKPGFWHAGLHAGEHNFKTPWDRFKIRIARSRAVDQPYLGQVWYWQGGKLCSRPQFAGHYSETETRLVLPCGYLVILCLIVGLPAMKLIGRVIRHRRRRPGLCRYCGYDLRASTIRCPECGAPIPVRAKA